MNNVVVGNDHAFDFDEDALSRTLKSNVASPAPTAQAYLPYLEKGSKKFMNISSSLSSLLTPWVSISRNNLQASDTTQRRYHIFCGRPRPG
ncbi:hypothetical protein BJV78DRAFT_1334992 [Lactifluus subvellereus]|nr:hypothetical protein BJV78DRAFT_1334992 [Lactifluus subvellereus]